jgi:membrane protein DedA with SNARE-associated domain
MLDALIGVVAGLGRWAYAVIFVGAALESAAFIGFVVPGETLVILGGFLAAAGVLELPPLIAAVSLGGIVGDSIGYELGRHLGRPWLLKHGDRIGLPVEALARVDRFFERHGGKAVLLGRFVGVLRALAPFVAGSSRMPYPVFLVYNATGAILWATTAVLAGYVLGESWQVGERWMGRINTVVGVVVVLVVVTLWRRARRRAR